MQLSDLLLVAAAGLLSGAVNAIAGGGSLILFPALVATGMPTLAANVTNSVSGLPGYLGGVLGFRRDLAGQRRRVGILGLVALAGSSLGAALLLNTSRSAFDRVVPVLVLLAAALMVLQPAVKKRLGEAAETDRRLWRVTVPAVFLATVYGGYFTGALSVIILGTLALTLADSLRRLNALKSSLSAINTAVAVAVFAVFGPVHWYLAAVAAPATLLGGYLGAKVARHLNDTVLRWCVIAFSVAVAIYLAVR